LYESQNYFKNMWAIAAWQQAAASLQRSLTTENSNSSTDNTPSAVEKEKEKKKHSPAISMAEASLLSEKAALLERDNFKTMLALQNQESQNRAQDSALERDQCLKELQLNHEGKAWSGRGSHGALCCQETKGGWATSIAWWGVICYQTKPAQRWVNEYWGTWYYIIQWQV
jgi:hypothetical protein